MPELPDRLSQVEEGALLRSWVRVPGCGTAISGMGLRSLRVSSL
jgi:hypothetical protein